MRKVTSDNVPASAGRMAGGGVPARVLFLQSQSFFGADSAVHATLMRHLDPRRVEVHVVCNRDGQPVPEVSAPHQLARIPGLRLRMADFGSSGGDGLSRPARAASRGLRLARTVAELARLCRSAGIQVIHGTEKPRDAVLGVSLARLTGAKSVVHLHVKYADWLSPKVRWALRNADAVIGVSGWVADGAVACGLAPARVHAVPNCMDLSDPARAPWDPGRNGGDVRRELGIPADALVFGAASRLFAYKGHADMLRALAAARPSLRCDWRMVIAGEDDPRANPGGGSHRAELEALCRDLDLSDRVIFPGFRADTPRLFSAFDVYAMPSFEEPLGMVFLEAMASGKPVLAYASGGVPEVVTDGVCGLLAPERDIAGLTDRLLMLAGDPDLRRRMGAAGRRRMEEVLTPAKMCAEVTAVYESLIAQERRVARTAGATAALPAVPRSGGGVEA